MPSTLARIALGLASGLAAAAAMDAFQRAAAKPFGQGGGDDEPATVKAAEDGARLVGAGTIPEQARPAAGSAVHYATGAALGVAYVLAAERWPETTAGFGLPYGLATALLLDEAAVPALGWGPPPTETPASTHAYGLASHLVFGAALEGARRVGERFVKM